MSVQNVLVLYRVMAPSHENFNSQFMWNGVDAWYLLDLHLLVFKIILQ